jgi:hypothetical protein
MYSYVCCCLCVGKLVCPSKERLECECLRKVCGGVYLNARRTSGRTLGKNVWSGVHNVQYSLYIDTMTNPGLAKFDTKEGHIIR